MPPSNPENHLGLFLTYTDAQQLGEGDINAGANLLAAAACAISNIASPGSGAISPNGQLVKVGTSTLVRGPLSSSIIQEQIVNELTTTQNNWLSHVRRLRSDIQKNKTTPNTAFPLPEPKVSGSEGTLLQLLHPEGTLWGTLEESWAEVLSCPPTPQHFDLIKTPKVIVTAPGTASALNKQLIGLHSNHPLVIMKLTAKSGCPELAEICSNLMMGSHSTGPTGETIDGNMLILDSEGRLSGLVDPTKDTDIRWLGSALWLVDSNSGPEPDQSESCHPMDNMSSRIKQALLMAMANRLNHTYSLSPPVEIDLTAAQVRWISFLKKMERSLPGISGSARKLLASLVYGLHHITTAKGFTKYDIPLHLIEHFARHLVRRMANARNAIYTKAEAELRTKRMRTILIKLQDGSKSPRELYRSLNIDSAQCHEIMEQLEAKGKVEKCAKKWQLTEMAAPTLNNSNLLEV